MVRTLTGTLALLSVVTGRAAAQDNEHRVEGDCARFSSQLGKFGPFVTERMRALQIPGLTIGFFKGDCTWIAAYGFADLEARVPTKVESAYRYASVQKSMTAAAVLWLADQKRIDLDAEIQSYVRYFPRKRWPVTVRQLLGHLGGIPHYVNRDLEQHITVHKTTKESIAIFANYDLVAEPGTRYGYSSYGYNLLGAAIEGVSHRSYGHFMRLQIWGPLGMTSVRLDDPRDLIENRVRGYQLVGGEIKNSEPIDVSSRFAAGGARGTVPDLLRFLRGMADGKLLSAAGFQLFYSPMKTTDGKPIGYSAGWQIPPVANRGRLVMNDGGQQETRTFILLDPDSRLGIALAMNLEADVYGPIIFRLYQLVEGKPLAFERR